MAKKESAMTASDRRWQAEQDARTLADSRVIMSDPSRLKGAATAAKRMAADKMTEAKAMTQIARKAPGKSSGKKGKK